MFSRNFQTEKFNLRQRLYKRLIRSDGEALGVWQLSHNSMLTNNCRATNKYLKETMNRQVYINSEYSNCITAIKYLMHIDSNDGYAKLFYLFVSDLSLVHD